MTRSVFGQGRVARAAVVAIVVCSLVAGCVSAPVVPQTRHQANLGRVAVVAGSRAPDISFKGFVHGKGEAALAGGGVTFLTCSAGLASGMGGCAGPFCGAVVILWLGVCGVAGTVGTVVGEVSAPKKKEVRAAETTMRSALDARVIQESLTHQVIAAAGDDSGLVALTMEREAEGVRDYRPLADAGIQTVLEVTLVKVGTEGGGICLTLGISRERLRQVCDQLNRDEPLPAALGDRDARRERMFHIWHTEATQRLLVRIVDSFLSQDDDRDLVLNLGVTELLSRMLRQQGRQFLLACAATDPTRHALTAVLRHIDDHLDQPLEIDQLCRIACMSRSKFYEQFRAAVGCGAMEYIQQRRLERAREWLAAGRGVTEVCYAVGYVNPSHFTRRFHQQYGMSPKAYGQGRR